MNDPMVTCSHGIRYTQPCPECEVVWVTEQVENIRRMAKHYGYVLVPEPLDSQPEEDAK